jgi:hypothetical protein
MSAIITGLVWELPIQGEFGRPEKYILLAYADHADQNGRSIYPSVELVAQKTGYEERAVQQITHRLESMGYLVDDGTGPHGTNRWLIPLERDVTGGAKIAPRIPVSVGPAAPPDMAASKPAKRGAKNAPLRKNAPEGNAPEGIAPEPSVEVKKIQEEEGKTPKFDFSQTLIDELERAGVYRANWTDVALYLRAGNDERDVFALLAWMRSKAPDAARAAQRFVTRIRERTHAPDGFYPISEPESVCAGVCVSAGDDLQADPCAGGGGAGGVASADAPISPTGITAGDAWRLACGQLELEMRRETFVQYMGGTVAYSWDDAAGVLCVQARTEDVCDWLRDRVTRTAERLLAGILNRDVAVRWVAVQAEAPA